MERKIMATIIVCMLLVLAFTPQSFAALKVKSYTVTANIPQLNEGMDPFVSKVTPGAQVDCQHAPAPDIWPAPGTPSESALNFGTLVWDSTNKIFRGTYYFAVDIGVLDNTGTVWTITHTKTSVKNVPGTDNLDYNINVAFMKQTIDNPAGTQLDKVAFGDSGGKYYTKTTLSPGWLRVYYGIGTGNTVADLCPDDAPNVVPIGLTKPYGTYTGSITFTLTP